MLNFSRKPMMGSMAHVYIYIAKTICLKKDAAHMGLVSSSGIVSGWREITSHSEQKANLAAWADAGMELFIMLLIEEILHLASLYHYLQISFFHTWKIMVYEVFLTNQHGGEHEQTLTWQNHGAVPGCFISEGPNPQAINQWIIGVSLEETTTQSNHLPFASLKLKLKTTSASLLFKPKTVWREKNQLQNQGSLASASK